MEEYQFSFERGRGVVWVCDIENSSKFLNDDESATAMEAYLPRLHWVARVAVEAAGGQFIKWTGDGFLAWFPCELHRELGAKGGAALHMIWHLTTISNVTRLGVKTESKFRLRHGVTFEHDALITRISNAHSQSMDLIGRAVVLAFRLCGINAKFPGVVAQKEIVDAALATYPTTIRFQALQIRNEERSRYFKGERWGTHRLVASSDRAPRQRSKASLLRSAKKAVAQAESKGNGNAPGHDAIALLISRMAAGPQWSKDVLEEYIAWGRDDLLSTLKTVIEALESNKAS